MPQYDTHDVMKAFALKEEHAEVLEMTKSLEDLIIHRVLAGMGARHESKWIVTMLILMRG